MWAAARICTGHADDCALERGDGSCEVAGVGGGRWLGVGMGCLRARSAALAFGDRMGVAREWGAEVLKGWEGWRKEGLEKMALGRRGRGMRRHRGLALIVGDERSSSVPGALDSTEG